MALWLCSYVAMWLYGYVAMWLCGYVDKFTIFLKSIYVKIMFFEDAPMYFLIFLKVFWYNKSHKYGVKGPRFDR